jgi:hypothetical protein
MLNLKSNIFSILLITSIFVLSCGKVTNIENNIDLPSEFSGYEYQEKGLVIYIKNYNSNEIKITIDSKGPTSISNKKNSDISELFFKNSLNDYLSIKIEDPSGIKSILTRNPDIAYVKKPFLQTFDIRYNQTVFIKEANSTVTLLNVSEDSRCPDPLDNKGAKGINLSKDKPGSCLHIPKTKIILKILTPRFKPFEAPIVKEQLTEHEFTYGGNSYKIKGINPEILKLNRIIPKDEYSVTLIIQEIK